MVQAPKGDLLPPHPNDAVNGTGFTGTTDNGLNSIDLFKIYWSTWEQTLQERTDYNKYYTNLLFINALVAVLVAALGSSNLNLLTTNLVVMLLAAVFFVAGVVATGWCVRLWTIRNVVDTRKIILASMATSLHMPYNLMDEENKVELNQSKWAHRIDTFTHYIIPVSMIAVFGLLFSVMALQYFGVIQI